MFQEGVIYFIATYNQHFLQQSQYCKYATYIAFWQKDIQLSRISITELFMKVKLGWGLAPDNEHKSWPSYKLLLDKYVYLCGLILYF